MKLSAVEHQCLYFICIFPEVWFLTELHYNPSQHIPFNAMCNFQEPIEESAPPKLENILRENKYKGAVERESQGWRSEGDSKMAAE